jgi:hypothetical protein
MIMHSCCHLEQANLEPEAETKAVESVKNGLYLGPHEIMSCRMVMLAVVTIQKMNMEQNTSS